MASHLRLQEEKAHHLLAAVFAAVAQAEAARQRETAAACTIQAMVRMCRAEWQFRITRQAAITIQKTFRGFCGRLMATDAAISREQRRQAAFFTHFAIVIQRRWRGYYSRKWRSNYHELKSYLVEVLQRSEEVKDIAEQYRHEAIQEQERQRQEGCRREFNAAASSLHHLVSTAAIPGVYRDPATGLARPTVFGPNVEEALRSQPIPRPKLSRSPPVQPVLRGSLRAAVPYDAVLEAQRMEGKLGRQGRIAGREFHVRKADELGRFTPGHNLAPYVPPAKFRMMDKSQNVAAQPFCSALHPTELFDDQGLPSLSGTTTVRIC